MATNRMILKSLAVSSALCLCVMAASAATLYTPWTAFRGTNQVTVATNPSTATLVIGPATPISTTASNAAKSLMVWTNESGYIHTLGSNLPSVNPLFGVDKQGTNIFRITTNGALFVGQNATDNLNINNITKTIVSSRSFAKGDSGQNGVELAVIDDDNFNQYSAFTVTLTNSSSTVIPVSSLLLTAQIPGQRGDFRVRAQAYDQIISLLNTGSTVRVQFNTTAANADNAVPHFLDTEIEQSIPGGSLLSIRNRGSEKLNVSKDGGLTLSSNANVTYTPSHTLGSGNGNTNYTLLTDRYKSFMGSSNVNIVAAMQTVAGQVRNCSVSITNLSADTWGLSFSSVTNRWRFHGLQGGGTNAPTVLTNNTELVLNIEFFGTNGTVEYKYLRPAL